MATPDVGDKAPGFELPDHEGQPRSLERFLGQPLVLYFYPGDFTPFCTREACTFEEQLDQFEGIGAQVVGISQDPPETHAEFREAHDLSFPLLSDERGEVIAAYGADGIFGTRRMTFLIGSDGRILERIASPLPGSHIKRSLARLEEA